MKKKYVLALCSVLMIGCASSFQVEVKKGVVVEYGEPLNKELLFESSKSDEGVSVKEIKEFNAKKLGNQKIIVVFENEAGKIKEEEMTITVNDTKAPVIELKEEMIELSEDDDYECRNNIASVKDLVDGDLEYSDKKIEKNGYYIDVGDFNKSKVGSYEITVKAIDVNGNESDVVFQVVVKEKEVSKNSTSVSSDAEYSSSSSNYESSGSSSSASNNGSDASTSSNTSGSSIMEPTPELETPQCTIHSSNYGNSGMIFATMEEAEAWAWAQLDEWSNEYWDWTDALSKIWLDENRRPRDGMEKVAEITCREDGRILSYKFYPNNDYKIEWSYNGFWYGKVSDTCNNSVGYFVDFY